MFAIIVAVLIIIVLTILSKAKNVLNNLPPGPTPLPLFGNILQFDRRDPRRTFLKWKQKYGPIYTVWIGTTPQVFICSYKLMQDSFIKNAEDYADRAENWLISQFTKGDFGIVFSSGDSWKEQRRFSLQTMRNFGFGRKLMEEKVAAETEKFRDMIEQKLSNKSSNVINISRDLELCVGNCISSLLVGHTFESSDDPILVKLKTLMTENFQLYMKFSTLLLQSFHWLKHIPLFNRFGYDEFKKQNGDFHKVIRDELKNHKQDIELNEEPNDFAAAYLQEIKRRGDEPSSYSEWQLISIMLDLWVAGMDTTITTMMWGFLFMMKHPDVQTRVQNEIDTVVGRQRLPNMADKAQMPYTQAVLQEILRMGNILLSNFGRLAAKDTVIGGYKIAKGTTVVPQLSVSNMDDDVFPNPATFNPDNFLEEDKITFKKVDEFVPFSVGKRSCLGEGLARMEMFLILTSILQKFRLTWPNDDVPINVEPVFGLSMVPHAYKCKVEIR